MKNVYTYNGRIIRATNHDYTHACIRKTIANNDEIYVVSCNKNKELAESAKRREAKEFENAITDLKKELAARKEGKKLFWWFKDCTTEYLNNKLIELIIVKNSIKVIKLTKA